MNPASADAGVNSCCGMLTGSVAVVATLSIGCCRRRVHQVDVSVSRTTDGGVPVLAVSGEVDVYSAPTLKERFAELINSGASTLVVDLTGVAFLDSTGLGALVEARALTGDAGGSLLIVCTQERIMKLFTITGLDSVFTIHSTVDAALEGAAG